MLGDFVTVPILYQHGKARIQSDKQKYAAVNFFILKYFIAHGFFSKLQLAGVKLKITHLI